MNKKLIITFILILLTVSMVSAGLLDEAKKAQERRKVTIEDKAVEDKVAASPLARQAFFTKNIPKTKEPVAKKLKKAKKTERGVIRPNEKIMVGDYQIVIKRLITYDIKEKDGITTLDLGNMVITLPREDLKLIFKEKTKKAASVGIIPPTGMPIKKVDNSITKSTFFSKLFGTGKTGIVPPTGMPIKTLDNAPTKDSFFPKTLSKDSKVGTVPPTGMPIADNRRMQRAEFEPTTQRFRVSNPKETKGFGFSKKGTVPPTGMPVRKAQEPRIITKLKELFGR